VEFARGGVVPISRASASSILRHLWAEQAARCASPLAAETDHHHVASWDDLTTREREVVQLVAMGARDREIAQQLVVSHNTVKKHVKSILHKLGARNRAEAAARLTHTRIRNRS
jgi:DNA-binding NarL/FixJ family response regulator